MDRFNVRLNGPTSTSLQAAVAMRFGGDEGIMIELNNDGDWNSEYLRIFSCSWISSYHGEDEMLMIGGRHRMRIEGVTHLQSKTDYKLYFHALFYFDAMLNGSAMDHNTSSAIRSRDCGILETLIRCKLKEKGSGVVDEYMMRTFEAFCVRRRQIVLNLFSMKRNFEKMSYLVLDEGGPILNRIVFKLFQNLNAVAFITTNRSPWNVHPLNLRSIATLADRHGAVTFTVKADWETVYTFHINRRSWLHWEFHVRSSMDRTRYDITFETKTTNNKFPLDILTVSKSSWWRKRH